MTKGRRRVRSRLRYLVAVPIPYRDRAGKVLPRARRLRWQKKVQSLLTKCFGGATPVPSLGTNVVEDESTGEVRFLWENGQVLVQSACKNKAAYLEHRGKIETLADEMAEDLDQAAVLILAYDSDSVLIEYAKGKRRTMVR